MRQFNVNRRMLLIILCIVLICTFTLSIAYAALSAVLTINGNAEVVASNWNIHLDNPRVSSGSVTKTLPVISGNTMTFSSSLVDPGDFYEFVVDVVNDGTIDAMIDSVSVTPTLTDSQKKYLRYEVTYQNGESISSKQTLRKGSSMPIKVRVEFRSDIPISDLPSTATTLNHKVTLVYSQSDGTGSSVIDDGVYYPFKVGNELCLGEECFYVMYSDESTVTLLAKYNLYVGGEYVNGSYVSYGESATGIQNSNMGGYIRGQTERYGGSTFSTSTYWSSTVTSYPSYVYNSNSRLYNYVENYKLYLEGLGATINEARLLSRDEFLSVACSGGSSCSNGPDWIFATSYWTGTAIDDQNIYAIVSDVSWGSRPYYRQYDFGTRPVIVVPKWQFADEIEFTVDGWVYTAKEGMTWADWVESEFDSDDDFGIDGEYIGHFRTDDEFLFMEHILNNPDCNDEGDICGFGTFVIKDDIIIPGHDYYGG